MRRLALPAALACLVTVALPTAVPAAGLGLQDACPAGPAQVASYTDIEPTVDGQAAGVDFALEEGCDAVEVSLLSYQLAPGPTPLEGPEQVLYDVATTTAPAGRVNHLEVAVVPDCWSLVKLVVGRPPAGATDPAQIRAWDRRNTVHSKWRDGQQGCVAAPSPLERDGLLGTLLQGPDAPTSSEAPAGAGSGDPATGRAMAGNPAAPDRAAPKGQTAATVTTAGTTPEAGPGDPVAGAAAAGQGQAPSGGAAQEGLAAPAQGGTDGRFRPAAVIAADGALPLTGANAAAALVAGIALVVVGAALLRLGKRHRARHLASS